MLIDTKYFGEINVEDSKIIHFENGLFGFEEYKDFTMYMPGNEDEVNTHSSQSKD